MFVKIKNPKAKRILEDLAALDLIEISDKPTIKVSQKSKSDSKTLTHIASEKWLAKLWDNAKEDKAWRDL